MRKTILMLALGAPRFAQTPVLHVGLSANTVIQ